MFIRKKYNKSSKTTSVHIQETVDGKSRFIKNIGKASNEEELEKYKQEIAEADKKKK